MTDGDVKKGRKTTRLFPYAYERRGLNFELESAVLDGEREAGNLDASNQVLRLDAHDWEHASVEFAVSVKADVVSEVLPRPEGQLYPVEFLVARRCDATLLREGRTFDPVTSALDVPTPVTFELHRSRLRDSVEFVPFLVRTTTDRRLSPRYARETGARLADGRGWTVRVDRTERTKSRHLDINYIKFSEQQRFSEYEDRVYLLEADTEKPTLWLNRDHPQIVQVLDSTGTRGGAARIRDVFFDTISQSVWTQLFVQAAAEIDEYGEFDHEWQRAVVERFAPKLFPEYDEERRIELVRDRMGDPRDAANLLRDLDLELQSSNELARHFSRLVEEVVES